VNVEYLDIADFIAIAQAVTGLDLQTVMNVTNIDLADSALHAPAAGFGDDDFYPDFVDKAAGLWARGAGYGCSTWAVLGRVRFSSIST
jgi:death on curing protein